MRCVNCRKANLETKRAEMSGEVHGENYSVECNALVCPNCGFKTVGSAQVQEFVRLLADEYRKKHGLLTSAEIVGKRKAMGWTQMDLAANTGVGLASIKRWELGKIQDLAMDKLLRLYLDPQHASDHARFVSRSQRRHLPDQQSLEFSNGEDTKQAYKPVPAFFYDADFLTKC